MFVIFLTGCRPATDTERAAPDRDIKQILHLKKIAACKQYITKAPCAGNNVHRRPLYDFPTRDQNELNIPPSTMYAPPVRKAARLVARYSANSATCCVLASPLYAGIASSSGDV